MTCTVVTTTWNSVDLISTFLAHYARLGVRRIVVMDYDSSDGTRDVLASSVWRELVFRVAFPGLASLDSSNLMLDIARRTAAPGEWLLFSDPDELLVIPQMRLDGFVRSLDTSRTDYVELPRFNMTGPVSVIEHPELETRPASLLTLRVDRRTDRDVSAAMHAAHLEPPWIFTKILPKVMVRSDAAVSIGEGDHSAQTRSRAPAARLGRAYLLHYPFRGYATFEDKVVRARRDYDANPHLPPGFGWQVRRWIRLHEQGRLRSEYREQFILDRNVGRLIADQSLSRDETIRRFHAGQT